MHHFKQSMMIMNNSLKDVLLSQQQMQNDTAHTLTAIWQAQLGHANDSLIDGILTFDGTPNKYFEWILKLENIPVVT